MLNTAQAAKILGTDQSTVRGLAKAGYLLHVQIGSGWAYDLNEVVALRAVLRAAQEGAAR